MTNLTDAFLTVEPMLSIGEGLQALRAAGTDRLGFAREGGRLLAHRDDLDKMAAMGLSDLPVQAIALPENSPMLQGERCQLRGSADYSRRLTAYFPVYFVAAMYELQSLMQRFDMKGYVIGGITRDLLLYHEKRLTVRDVDMTIEGDALAFTGFLTENSRNFEVEEAFPEFGTARVRYKDTLSFDVASTRQEIYTHCGALPVVVSRGVPLVNDIIRRDFTANGLAFSIHTLGHVLDYSGGIRDVEAGRLRVLHPVSFFEDPSRIIRAMKFCARFEAFDLAEETRLLLESFMRYGAQCYKGGGDRIKQELKSFLDVEESPRKSRWLRFFMESGGYRLFHMSIPYQPAPEALDRLERIATVLPEVESALSRYTDPDFRFDVYLCFLCQDWDEETYQTISARLGLTRNEREFTAQVRRLGDPLKGHFGALHEFSSPAEIYDLFRGLRFVTVAASLVTLGFTDKKRMKTVLEAFLTYKRKWEKLELELDGNDLIDLGVPKGKDIGQLLDRMLHAKLVGQLPDRLDEVQYVRQTLATPPADEKPAAAPELANAEVEGEGGADGL